MKLLFKSVNIIFSAILIYAAFFNVAFAQLLTDGTSKTNPLWNIVAGFITLFVFLGLPILAVALFVTFIYLIIKKIKGRSKQI